MTYQERYKPLFSLTATAGKIWLRIYHKYKGHVEGYWFPLSSALKMQFKLR